MSLPLNFEKQNIRIYIYIYIEKNYRIKPNYVGPMLVSSMKLIDIGIQYRQDKSHCSYIYIMN